MGRRHAVPRNSTEWFCSRQPWAICSVDIEILSRRGEALQCSPDSFVLCLVVVVFGGGEQLWTTVVVTDANPRC